MEYVLARTLDQALSALGQPGRQGRVIAGGTDVVIDVEEGKIQADILVDITRIPTLAEIREEDGYLLIGATATLTQISRSPLVRRHAPSLAQAAGRVGSLQIGNAATLTGNVISAQPAADAAMALAVLNAVFTVRNQAGERQVPMTEMYAGFGKSSVDSSQEIVTQIRIPCLAVDEAAAFIRLELRKSLALPMLNAAAAAKIRDGRFIWARIAMGPVGVGPTRAAEAEAWLAGKAVTAGMIRIAGELALENANPRSNLLRGSREYRLQTLPVLVRRALADCAKQLGYGGDLA